MPDAARLEKIGRLVTIEADRERGFDERLRECCSLAVRVAYSVVRHRQDAEDVAQEAFTRAYEKFAQLRDRDRFRAWLVRMTWRLALDRHRSEKRRLIRETAAAVRIRPASVESDAIAGERAARLWAAIDGLPEKLRLTIVLSAIEGYDTGEVAGLLGVPEGTIKSRLFVARKHLAESLQCLTNDNPHR
ncbi:MAG: RNA polymerase sigma factor [Vicinamibacterales bacterium]